MPVPHTIPYSAKDSHSSLPSPMPPSIPPPPLSIITYLQHELASDKPSPMHIHRSATSDFPYESSKIKFERLMDFLFLPPQVEHVLWFGTLACLDDWLYTLTILPLRFFKALWVLIQWWVGEGLNQMSVLIGHVWRRRQRESVSASYSSSTAESQASASTTCENDSARPLDLSQIPTNKALLLLPNHKADLLKGLLVLLSCIILMRFDASRMYHGIRGQAAIKLYVIYNVLEVCDRLFSALGQDILECLFSRETLERNRDGRSKIIRPFWMFLLALAYNVIHSAALFYQVITLNVAVNSYSNALLTLLMSNQFVEIKGTVFKKFEKENLFQITCADIVERFQLWLMLVIIAFRNIIEVGGLSISLGESGSIARESGFGTNASTTSVPLRTPSIIPKSFMIFHNWTGQVLSPFLLVLGSEMIVDWVKHAYITKFNNTKPAVYGRFLDVLAKDYYSHAFSDQNLTKRLGLPVLPLSCLYIRAIVQTYHMFISIEQTNYPIWCTLERSLCAIGIATNKSKTSSSAWLGVDDYIALAALLVVFLIAYLILLLIKLALGMALLAYARSRYVNMKVKEGINVDTGGRRVSGWGVVDVDEEKKRWFYADDPDGWASLKEHEARMKERDSKGISLKGLGGVSRYKMVAKRIW